MKPSFYAALIVALSLIFLVSPSENGLSQTGDDYIRQCLTIVDVDARVDCLEGNQKSLAPPTQLLTRPTRPARLDVESLPPAKPAIIAPPTLEPDRPKIAAITDSKTTPPQTPQNVPSFGFPFTAIILLCVAFFTVRILLAARRRRLAAAEEERLRAENWTRLVAKYGESDAALIVARKAWLGMTAEQLLESWGRPVDVDREAFRDQIRETWKYQQTGKNRFKQRIRLENGSVIGIKSN